MECNSSMKEYTVEYTVVFFHRPPPSSVASVLYILSETVFKVVCVNVYYRYRYTYKYIYKYS